MQKAIGKEANKEKQLHQQSRYINTLQLYTHTPTHTHKYISFHFVKNYMQMPGIKNQMLITISK